MKSLRKHLIAVALVLGTGTLFAGPSDPVPTESRPSEAPKPGQLSHEEMVRQVGPILEHVEQDDHKVQGLQAKARKEKDVIKLNCINDKLLQIRALRNIIERQRGSVEMDAGSLTAQNDAFNGLTSNASAIRVLREQAQLCAGEGELQNTSNNGFEGPHIPDDPGKNLFPDGVEPPGYASPYN